MTKEMILKRLETLAAASQCETYNTEINVNEWEKYGKSRTYFSIVRTRDHSTHYQKLDCGYYDNIADEYVAGKHRDLSEESVFDFGGNYEVVFANEEKEVVEEITEIEEETETVVKEEKEAVSMKKLFLESNGYNMVGFLFDDGMVAFDCETLEEAKSMDIGGILGCENAEEAASNCNTEVVMFSENDWENVTEF